MIYSALSIQPHHLLKQNSTPTSPDNVSAVYCGLCDIRQNIQSMTAQKL